MPGKLNLECGPLKWTQLPGETPQALRKRIKADLREAHGGKVVVIEWPREMLK